MFHWLSFLTYSLVTAITPGPNNLMALSNGTRLGFWRALPFNLGVTCGCAVALLLCAAACSLLSAYIPKFQLPMLVVGALYMLWLAWKTLRSTGDLETGHTHGGFVAGTLLQFVNPKFYLYGIVSMEAYILPYYHGRPVAVLGFSVLLAVIAGVCTALWSAFGSAFRRLFSAHARVVNAVMAALLALCAASLFL